MYTACTNVEADYYWCSTKVNGNGTHTGGNWGICNSECPTGKYIYTLNYSCHNKKELIIIMKSWGLNPSMNDVQDIMNELDDSGDGEFDFPEFIEIMATRMQVTMGYIAREDIKNFPMNRVITLWSTLYL